MFYFYRSKHSWSTQQNTIFSRNKINRSSYSCMKNRQLGLHAPLATHSHYPTWWLCKGVAILMTILMCFTLVVHHWPRLTVHSRYPWPIHHLLRSFLRFFFSNIIKTFNKEFSLNYHIFLCINLLLYWSALDL